MTRAVWLGREVVGVPDDAMVMFPSDDTRAAVVAWPVWRACVIVADGGVIEPSAEVEQELLRDYFGG